MKIDQVNSGGIVAIRDGLLDMQSKGKQVYRLESGDPSFSISPNVKEAIEKALRDGHTHYTAGPGIKPLREAIYEKLCNQMTVSSFENIFITNGAMHGLYITFQALLEEGDVVLAPTPTWTETYDNIKLAGGRVVSCPELCGNGSIESIETKITKSTKAIVINTPHNPTGFMFNINDLEKIVQIANKYNLFIISDEAYEHITYDKEHVSIASISGAKNIVSIFSFSKSYAMSGLRLGYLVTDNKLLSSRISKLVRCTINGVNSATQYGGVAAIKTGQNMISMMNKEYLKRRDILFDALSKSDLFEPVLPDGAFYIWAKVNKNMLEKKSQLVLVDAALDPSYDLANALVARFGIGSAPGVVFINASEPILNDDIYLRFAFSCRTPDVIAASEILSKMNGLYNEKT